MRGLQLGDHAQLRGLHVLCVGALHQQPAADALVVERIALLGQRHFEQAYVLPCSECRPSLGRDARRYDHLDELIAHDRARRSAVKRLFEGDDAAVRRRRIGLEGLRIRLGRGAADRHAAGVRVLDDDTRGRIERLHALPRRIGIGDVVVRKFLALQLRPVRQGARRRLGVAVERGALVRVLAIAQFLRLRQLHAEHRRVLGALRHAGGRALAAVGQRGEVVGDHAVVGGGVREHLLRQHELGGALDLAGLQLGEHARVVHRVDDDRHVLPVLRRGTQHRRAADVDVLDRVFQRAVGPRGGLRERVEVDDQEVDRRDAVLLQRRHVRRQIAPREQAAVDARVQRLHAAVEHLGKAGDLGHFGDGQAGLGEQLGGAAGGQQLDAGAVQFARELDDAGLVGDGEQGLHGNFSTWRACVRRACGAACCG